MLHNEDETPRSVALLDIDNTLLYGVDEYNDRLLTALKEKGIKDVILFTDITDIKEQGKVIEYLKKNGFKVHFVEDKLELKAKGNEKKRLETQLANYGAISSKSKLILDVFGFKRNIPHAKGIMFEQFLKHKPKWVSECIYCEDDKEAFEAVAKVSLKADYPIKKILVSNKYNEDTIDYYRNKLNKPYIKGYSDYDLEDKKTAKEVTFNQGDFLIQEKSFGLCRIQGAFGESERGGMILNKRQQDAITAVSISDFSNFDPSAQENFLKQTVEQMQAKHGQSHEVGSTLCALVTWVDIENKKIKCITANVGDSFACFVSISQGGNVRVASQLNELHENKEREKIKLGVSRAIGDREEEVNGLTHDPDIKYHEFDLKDGDWIFAIVACDGLATPNNVYNTPALTIDDIAKVVQKNKDKSTAEIAQALVNAAYREGKGSTDNISVGVVAVGKTPTLMVVADGHGVVEELNTANKTEGEEDGGKVAQGICDDFYPSLRNNMLSTFSRNCTIESLQE